MRIKCLQSVFEGISTGTVSYTEQYGDAFFMIQLSHPYMTTGKTIVLTIQTLVGKVMPLLCNTLSRFVIVFLPRSKQLLIPWLQSLLVVVLYHKKIHFGTVSTFLLFPIK